ncbi:phosphatidate cytidylyltransferase [Leuconostoc gelidum subsp. aenigmaticum]|uniref:phosphatidate cytidylyltransferase n=1 Tax=Leuconostoc gelidum TaxID=1244 RepID=UPI001C7CC15B|nr:phosphatidate cytidylyltransferase [Leuconostoc gelidum]MBZ6002626.1 phosphatidate cytidylyltransferase [Leuconostoc gelidum subsp. aenigmaticum]MBZ6011037.1 phosphatidate cytidylyltransferase [Leuconostoc gelidum subsp. aenigmaticum]
MKVRVITAVVALLIFVPLLIIGKLPLLILTLIMGVIAMSEILRMKHIILVSTEALISFMGVIAITLPNSFWHDIPFIKSAHIVFYILAFLMLLNTVLARSHFNFDDAGALTLAMLYIGTGFHYFFQAASVGLPTVFFGMLIVWITDSGAYMFGRALGKHKLAPKISPNKTWEGSIGGSVVAIVIIPIIFSMFKWLPNYGLLELLVFAIILSIAGQLGDLIESGFKRHYGVKDSGNILPGHGGILDRFDSMLIVMPLMAILGMLG